MLWLIGGISSLLAFGGAGWFLYQSRNVDKVRAENAEEKAEAQKKVLSNVEKAREIENEVAGLDGDNTHKRLQKWRRADK